MTNLPSSGTSSSMDNTSVTRAEFRSEMNKLLQYLAEALGNQSSYSTQAVSPTEVKLNGSPTAPTPADNDDSTKIATTAWVKKNGGGGGGGGGGVGVGNIVAHGVVSTGGSRVYGSDNWTSRWNGQSYIITLKTGIANANIVANGNGIDTWPMGSRRLSDTEYEVHHSGYRQLGVTFVICAEGVSGGSGSAGNEWAFGQITGSGSIEAGSSNFSVTKTATGMYTISPKSGTFPSTAVMMVNAWVNRSTGHASIAGATKKSSTEWEVTVVNTLAQGIDDPFTFAIYS